MLSNWIIEYMVGPFSKWYTPQIHYRGQVSFTHQAFRESCKNEPCKTEKIGWLGDSGYPFVGWPWDSRLKKSLKK